MATRRKTTTKRTAKKATRGKTSPRKSTGRGKARPAPRRKTATARKATASRKVLTPEALARKIVRATTSGSKIALGDFYSEECTSIEPGGGPPVSGLKALQAKNDWWDSIQVSQTWKANQVWVRGHTIAIEWSADVKLRDGRRVHFDEIFLPEPDGLLMSILSCVTLAALRSRRRVPSLWRGALQNAANGRSNPRPPLPLELT